MRYFYIWIACASMLSGCFFKKTFISHEKHDNAAGVTQAGYSRYGLIKPSSEKHKILKKQTLLQTMPVEKQGVVTHSTSQKSSYFIKNILMQEAFSDVPIALTSQLVDSVYDESAGFSAVYSCNLSLVQIKDLYLDEMEELGWKREFFFEGPETVMVFKKYDRMCTISLRTVSSWWSRLPTVTIHLFISA